MLEDGRCRRREGRSFHRFSLLQAAAAEVERLINALRAKGSSCGGSKLPAAGPVRWNPLLLLSAQTFVQELAERDELTHQGLKLVTLSQRLSKAGYRTRVSAENLSAGPETVEDVIDEWMASPKHCDNLMSGDYQDIALACKVNSGPYGHYWVLVMGAGGASD